MPYARAADNVGLYYETHGDGETLVLLAGQANNHHWWDSVLPDFAATYRTVVLDYRGTGRSDKPDTDTYGMTVFAADALAVIDDLGADRVHLYGTSMGGRVAQWVAAEHPERVDRLVLGCTSPGGRHGIERSAEVNRSLTQPDRDAARRALLELMYTPAWLAAHPGPYNTVGDPAMPSYARAGHLRASRRHDGWDLLPRIAAPTLVVHGTEDLLNPAANAALLAGRIRDARVEPVHGARHAYFEEFREVASPLVHDFLRGAPQPRTA
ncbi:MAG: alpha/beta fold hydrolase [Nocardioidaceae bacterium]